MSRSKKSRTAGNSDAKFDGRRKETSTQAKEAREKKRKEKLKGNKAGNRNAVESKQGAQQSQRQAKNDKRVGSKKPVALTLNDKPQEAVKPKIDMQPKVKVVKSTPAPQKAPVKISPEKELANIENDDRLNDLLEQAETDQALSKEDQAWVDQQLKRHQELMKELGWVDDEGEEDLLQQFEDASSALDEFR
ncbi:Der GTPase-activating protein YihI [Psychromonas sp. 14N.309.X.WAT.B.A12]|uniref:Der GTPase-activating protein YihI n=1 Tax=Psychromonas sp. 14N.309.X.WAT.B.A12 TaxID=2998322 RepID=UPI0025B21F70|nr:Der GTPase-activating protein YihI [Psychromonas sp. 14N.309.X.WAT.B.A12]MDN2664082.1 Der GTPase-activating protein YihI [Psychromonas sp. 14N.309.X.WAT.B.A12]